MAKAKQFPNLMFSTFQLKREENEVYNDKSFLIGICSLFCIYVYLEMIFDFKFVIWFVSYISVHLLRLVST